VPKKRKQRPSPRPRQVEVRHTPGLADSIMRELAPLLAEDGIDLDDPDLDLETLQQALNRAVERRNLALFTPVGEARRLAVSLVRQAVWALIDDEPYDAFDILNGAVPESADTTVAEVSSCMGVALGLVDEVLAGRHPDAPAGLGRRLRRSPIEGPGEVSALDILGAARHGGSFPAMQELMLTFGGRELHYGSANALP
jgi:hypothetical protein